MFQSAIGGVTVVVAVTDPRERKHRELKNEGEKSTKPKVAAQRERFNRRNTTTKITALAGSPDNC